MPFVDVPQLRYVFSQVSPLEAFGNISEHCLESHSRERQDLDTYNIDLDTTPSADDFRKRALAVLAEYNAVVTYRPTALLMDIIYPRIETTSYLGMFHGHQVAFEHKPWVETELRKAGIRALPWRYYADAEKSLIGELLAKKVVIRANRTDGGVGLLLSEGERRMMPAHEDRFIAATAFLDGALPLNINACVFGSGQVTIHGPSLQLIGIESCTNRRFGYCGNDFSAFATLGREVVQEFEDMTRKAGEWLGSKGYVGAFGVDALHYRDTLYLTEINPRFQGSSALSSAIDAAMSLPDLHLCHLAAFLGIPCPCMPPLADLLPDRPQAAHIVVHNTTGDPLQFIASSPKPEFRLNQVPGEGLTVKPNAILCELICDEQVTADGYSLTPSVGVAVAQAKSSFQCRQGQLAIVPQPAP